ncbi:hypothetical protein SEA_EMIANNA_8 [Gordonia phage Emianna]|uniref:Uncharacterized protein n=4 Tax=Foxborovirus TaxID=2948710 RepID=A0A385UCG3_9CAUD|nr:hypothetical protein KNT99_gp08 [Gordonia phage NatB6]YP_010098264.1 hypothetical protein KNU10_gp08 [Gordonia phage Foxboro]YP_010098356.1 hypothetical protein KNU11_gp08 [Gordonia phage KidneyBean]YP_010098896.1 hypothetical protein KNU15_gp08 [Gordonia phage Emianna]AYD84122.1 hypothetical protein SEA_JIFALL16_7 [Gordonia phage Jifall16]AYD84280.1 hypothetical protein SEA_KURT_8 [Gordonia phage Kurt]QOP66669.1 membrane protein [Gordonia phage NovumRegina]QOR55850.1 membrane protein [Go
MTDLAVRFLSLIGPMSALIVLLRIFESVPLSEWWPFLIFTIAVNALTVLVVQKTRRPADDDLILGPDVDEKR